MKAKDIKNVTVTMESYGRPCVMWETSGARYHVWGEVRSVQSADPSLVSIIWEYAIHMNPLEGGPQFGHRFLDRSAKVNKDAWDHILRIVKDERLITKGIADEERKRVAQKAAQEEASRVHRIKEAGPELLNALQLIANSHTFMDGTSIEELRGIARQAIRALGKDVAPRGWESVEGGAYTAEQIASARTDIANERADYDDPVPQVTDAEAVARLERDAKSETLRLFRMSYARDIPEYFDFVVEARSEAEAEALATAAMEADVFEDVDTVPNEENVDNPRVFIETADYPEDDAAGYMQLVDGKLIEWSARIPENGWVVVSQATEPHRWLGRNHEDGWHWTRCREDAWEFMDKGDAQTQADEHDGEVFEG